ncbi:MAG: hypothetical protein ACP5NV_03975 [Candidatus Woesearchaeota archaeon]
MGINNLDVNPLRNGVTFYPVMWEKYGVNSDVCIVSLPGIYAYIKDTMDFINSDADSVNKNLVLQKMKLFQKNIANKFVYAGQGLVFNTNDLSMGKYGNDVIKVPEYLRTDIRDVLKTDDGLNLFKKITLTDDDALTQFRVLDFLSRKENYTISTPPIPARSNKRNFPIFLSSNNAELHISLYQAFPNAGIAFGYLKD